MARIQEAKDVPVVRVIDAPGIPEKKSFPPRAIFIILLAGFIVFTRAAYILARDRWIQVDPLDSRKRLLERIVSDLRQLKRVPEYKR